MYSIMNNLPIQARITIRNGVIASVEPQIGGVVIDVEGQKAQRFANAWVMPGLVETHAHLLGVGMKMVGVSLSSAKSAEQCIDILKRKAIQNRGEWIVATGWNEESWTDKTMPTKELLDETFPNVPLFLQRI
jgi:predicted amidohydrolase YtcJ